MKYKTNLFEKEIIANKNVVFPTSHLQPQAKKSVK